jgi:hypothetical protein
MINPASPRPARGRAGGRGEGLLRRTSPAHEASTASSSWPRVVQARDGESTPSARLEEPRQARNRKDLRCARCRAERSWAGSDLAPNAASGSSPRSFCIRPSARARSAGVIVKAAKTRRCRCSRRCQDHRRRHKDQPEIKASCSTMPITRGRRAPRGHELVSPPTSARARGHVREGPRKMDNDPPRRARLPLGGLYGSGDERARPVFEKYLHVERPRQDLHACGNGDQLLDRFPSPQADKGLSSR